MITEVVARDIIEALGALRSARHDLNKVNELRPAWGKLTLRGYTRTNEAEYQIDGAEYAAVVLGYMRKKHETRVAAWERRLRALGAEVPPC